MKHSQAERLLHEGNEFYHHRHYEQALEKYSKALELKDFDDTMRWTLYNRRSATFNKLKRYSESLLDADKCTEIDPENPKGYIRKGGALFFLERPQEAFKAYEIARQLRDQSGEPLANYHVGKYIRSVQRKLGFRYCLRCKKMVHVDSNDPPNCEIISIRHYHPGKKLPVEKPMKGVSEEYTYSCCGRMGYTYETPTHKKETHDPHGCKQETIVIQKSLPKHVFTEKVKENPQKNDVMMALGEHIKRKKQTFLDIQTLVLMIIIFVLAGLIVWKESSHLQLSPSSSSSSSPM